MRRIQRCIGDAEVRFAYQTCKLRNFLSPKTPLPDDIRSKVIYSMDCDCEEQYVGRCMRHKITREREHLGGDAKSSFFEHLGQCQRPTSCAILDSAKTKYDLCIKEAFFIHVNKPSLNRRQEFDYRMSIIPPDLPPSRRFKPP